MMALPADTMSRELFLALLITLALVVAGVWLLEANQGRLPAWVEWLSRHHGWIWNAGIGLIIALSLLRFLLGR